MKQFILRARLFAEYHLCISVCWAILLASSIVWISFSDEKVISLVFILIIAMVFGVYSIPSVECKFDVGKVNKMSVLEVLGYIEEINRKIPVESLYQNRPKRPLLIFFLCFRGSMEKKLMEWMGVNPTGILIHDEDEVWTCDHKTRCYRKIAGEADVQKKEIVLDGSLRKKHPSAYLTTLVHEIAHMLAAQIHFHAYLSAFEEEFTDTLCVYLGLGDVMLNGCISHYHSETHIGSYVEWHKESVKIGYLTPMQLAIAEVITSEMANRYGSSRKRYSSRAYSLLTDIRVWFEINGITYKYHRDVPARMYLHELREKIAQMEDAK